MTLKSSRIIFHCTPILKLRIEEYAKHHDISVAQAIRYAMSALLEQSK